MSLIPSRLEQTPLGVCCELQSIGQNLLRLCDDYDESESDMMNEKKKRMIQFLGKQLIAHDKRRYYSDNMKDAVNLFLRRRCAYKALRELLILPCRNTITSYFGKLGLPGELEECKKKHCKSI